ncbi:hypothetical protein AwDysgo_13520 [Bacteroidales bacterium]|nr:hypothetical protein AwDysgo_13520 [Bacteroidales bacterium]
MGSDKKSIAVAAELNLKLMQAKNKKMKCKKENYFYLKGSGIDFRSQLKFVLEKYIPVFSTIRLVFFFEAESDDDFATCQYEIRKEMVRKFGNCYPVWSCVAQSPLEEGCKLAV